METVEYGRALYYPHMIFRSRAWMRTAALYHDNVARIVPDGVPYNTSELSIEEQKILEECYILEQHGIVSSEPPDKAIHSTVANSFYDFASKTLADPQRREKLLPELSASTGSYYIYKEKIDPALVEILEELGLARSEGPEILCDPMTGAMYMLFLARYMAKSRPIATDNPIYQALLYAPLDDNDEASTSPGDRGLILASAVLRTVVPIDIEAVPIHDLIKFREDHTGERIAFYNTISEMAKKFAEVSDPKELDAAIEHYTQTFQLSMDKLRNKLKTINVTCGIGVFTFSVPASLTATWGLAVTNPFILMGGGVLAISGILLKSALERKVMMADSGIAYVHSLGNKIGVHRYAEDLVQLNLTGAKERVRRESPLEKIKNFFRLR